MIRTGELLPSDREAWEALFRAYIDFYQRVEPPEMYERAWRDFRAGTRVHALGARLDDRLVAVAAAVAAREVKAWMATEIGQLLNGHRLDPTGLQNGLFVPLRRPR